MISCIRRLGALMAVAAAGLLAVAVPARAQTSYPPEVLSTAIVGCALDAIVVTVDGAQPNSTLHVDVNYQNAPDVTADVSVDALGFFTGSYPIPPNAGPIITVTLSGLDFDPHTPGGIPFSRSFDIDRRTCPGLPETGADSLPIGEIALVASVAGAFLIVIALRRRPRDRHAH